MRQVIWMLSFFYGLCFASIVLVSMFVPSIRGQDNLFQATGPWGTVIRVVIAAAIISSAAVIVLRVVRRRQVAKIDWPAAPLVTQTKACAIPSLSKLRVTFEQETETWVFSADEKNVAAFRDVQDKLGNELIVFDRRYTIARKFLRFGGTLMLDGIEVAKGTMPFTIEIKAGDKTFLIQGIFPPGLQKRRQMFLNDVGVCTYTRQRKEEWSISEIGDVELFVVVFGFWLVLHRARQDG